jgi:DNA-binding CsgD family transcriptional regulator
MPEAEQLSDLIGAIYDASLNPELWLPVLEQTSRFINSATATIGSRDMVQKHTSFSKAWGHDPHYLQLLESHYLKINPLNEGAALTRVGDVLSIGEVISATRALRSRSRLVRASATWPTCCRSHRESGSRRALRMPPWRRCSCARRLWTDLPRSRRWSAPYKLTPAELRVLLAIVEVGGIPEIAPMLGISEATVKTHLQHVFEKTGVNRQADLVKVVAGFMNPLG